MALMSVYDKLKFDANGLIPAIIQEQKSGRVLMMAWMNRASLEKTVETGKTHFWSRSRQKFWMKGESSGHTQTVKDIAYDCDGHWSNPSISSNQGPVYQASVAPHFLVVAAGGNQLTCRVADSCL